MSGTSQRASGVPEKDDQAYECKRNTAHKWRAPRGESFLEITTGDGQETATGMICPFCLTAWFREHFGAREAT